MKEGQEFNLIAINQKRKDTGQGSGLVKLSEEIAVTESGSKGGGHGGGQKFGLPFDPFRAADILWRRRYLCLAVGAVLGGAGLAIGAKVIKRHYTAEIHMVRRETPAGFRASESGEAFKPTPVNLPILQTIMQSPPLMRNVASACKPEVPWPMISSGLTVTPVKGSSDLVDVSFTSLASPTEAVRIINVYADELIHYTQQIQAHEAREMNLYLTQEMSRLDHEIQKANEDLLRYSKEENLLDGDKEMDTYLRQLSDYDQRYEGLRLDHDTLDLKIKSYERELAAVSPAASRISALQDEITQLKFKYTDENPLVQVAQEKLKDLQELAKNEAAKPFLPRPGENPMADNLYLELVQLKTQKNVLAEQMQSVEVVRRGVKEKLGQIPRKSMQYAIIKTHRQSLDTARSALSSRQKEAELFEKNAVGYCRLLASAREDDVIEPSRLPKILGIGGGGLACGIGVVSVWFLLIGLADGRIRTIGDLRRITRLPVLAALPASMKNDDSARQDWAFRTWTRLHQKLATSPGGLICGMLAEREGDSVSDFTLLLGDAAAWRGSAVIVITPNPPSDTPAVPIEEAFTGPWMMQVDHWLATGAGVIHIAVSSEWAWTTEQRELLQCAVGLWSRHPNAVVFVELPTASQAEALLIAERLPQNLWVGSVGARGEAIMDQLTLYRQSGCRMLGSFLYGAPDLVPSLLNRFGGLSTLLMVGLLGWASSGLAAEAQPGAPEAPAPAKTHVALPLTPSNAPVRLGPGDSLNIALFNNPDSRRTDVVVGADGCITYLQAQHVRVAGLTIDEIRAKLNEELAHFYQQPRAMVSPNGFQSRKIYVLGKIVKKGMINMDRPMSLLEAVTEAGGLETGLYQGNTVEMADLARSFLMRGNQKLPVDFEALFFHGDMSQNVAMEPGDYLYFPSANSNEIYVLGSVRNQGVQGLLAHSTVTSAITQAGGWGTKAYKQRILVVRGSLDKPEVHVVDLDAVLNAKGKAFLLEPKDIVYVADKPWSKAEDLLDIALSSFIQGAALGWATTNVPNVVSHPFIPNIR